MASIYKPLIRRNGIHQPHALLMVSLFAILGFGKAIENLQVVHQVFEHGNVSLKCEAKNSGDNVISWHRKVNDEDEDDILFVDDSPVIDDQRFSVTIDMSQEFAISTLTLKNAQSSDSALYVCKIGDVPQVHRVDVMVPLTVSIVPDQPEYIVNEGDNIVLSCLALGDPPAWISWKRQGNKLPDGEELKRGTNLTFDHIRQQHGGAYQCIAENQMGASANASIILIVHSYNGKPYAPVVKTARPKVPVRIGQTLIINCTYSAKPQAQIVWSFNGYGIDFNHNRNRISLTTFRDPFSNDNVTSLQIRNVRQTDFGTYSCQAMNNRGVAEQVIKVSGVVDETAKVERQGIRDSSSASSRQLSSGIFGALLAICTVALSYGPAVAIR